MTTTDDAPDPITDQLLTLVDRLERDLAQHEADATEIRATLAALRKRLASTPGARAGKHARSGRKRKPLIDITDLRVPQ